MKSFVQGVLLGLVVVVTQLWAVQQHAQTTRAMAQQVLDAKQRVTVLQAEIAEAKLAVRVDSVRVVQHVTATRTLRDTLLERLTDTMLVTEYVYRTDTLREACLRCVASAARLRVMADSTLAATTHYWQLKYDAVKPSRWAAARPWVFLVGGLYVGSRFRR